MTSSFYIKLLLGIVAGLAVIFFIASIAKADYSNGFQRVKDLVDTCGYLEPGLQGMTLVVPDTIHEANAGGLIALSAGEGTGGIGVTIDIVNKDGQPLVSLGLVHLHLDHTTVIIDFLKGTEDKVRDTTAQSFINLWFTIYEKAVGSKS